MPSEVIKRRGRPPKSSNNPSPSGKRRGRPPGSKNKPKGTPDVVTTVAPAAPKPIAAKPQPRPAPMPEPEVVQEANDVPDANTSASPLITDAQRKCIFTLLGECKALSKGLITRARALGKQLDGLNGLITEGDEEERLDAWFDMLEGTFGIDSVTAVTLCDYAECADVAAAKVSPADDVSLLAALRLLKPLMPAGG